MEGIFIRCFKLKLIKGINQFKTNKVIYISGMFGLCSRLVFLNLTDFDFDISIVSDMHNTIKLIIWKKCLHHVQH